MNRVLVSLAVVLAFSAVASAQTWLDARDLDGATPGGNVWELLPNTTTWISLHGCSGGTTVGSVVGFQSISDPGGNTGAVPTIVTVPPAAVGRGYTRVGGALALYDALMDWTAWTASQVYYQIGVLSATPVTLPSAGNDIVAFLEIDTTDCEISDWYNINLTGLDMYDEDVGKLFCSLIGGQIHIIPEPGTITLLVMGAAGLVLRRRRK